MERHDLTRRSLGRLGPAIGVPIYDVTALKPGIVHLGYGGFHRAHMARYTHNLMQIEPLACEWGVVGAGLMASDRRIYEALAPQDFLYTLVERDAAYETATVIGATVHMLDPDKGAFAVLEAADDPAIRIFSLTVTGGGYGLNAATKRLDPGDPAIAADLRRPDAPRSPIGVVVEAFRRRRMNGLRAFTALSCDNIQHNGAVLKQAVLDFAERLDQDLAEWIAREARFPSSMVDRITPVTRVVDTEDLARRYGVADRWPVFSETFSQWVIEDDFVDGRPDWDRVGAQFVARVEPYERMKLRLLNTSHLAIAGLGRLLGKVFIDEAMGDGRLRRYMQALMDEETGPTLDPVPGVDLLTYKATLIQRFSNPTLQDTIDRVNADAALNYLLDPIRDRLGRGQGIELLALGLAAWLRRVRGVDESGETIEVRHPLAAVLRERAIEGGGDPRPLLGVESLFGDLGQRSELLKPTARWLQSLYDVGAEETLNRAVARFDP